MSEPKASEPKKKTITEQTFFFAGGQSVVIAQDENTTITWNDKTLTFTLKDRTVVIHNDKVLWSEVRTYQVPVKEPAGPPQKQGALFG